jgi:hypothetical protein
MNEPLTTVATFGTPVEAELARNRLEEKGIAAVVVDAETVGMVWHMGGALGGVKVQVAESDAAKARAVLAARSGRSAFAADDYGVGDRAGRRRRHSPVTVEDKEHEEPADDTEADTIAGRAWRSAVIGLLLLPPLLHFYSAWLLFQLPWSRGQLSHAGKRKAIFAVVLNLLVLFGVVLLLRSLIVPPAPPPPGIPPPERRPFEVPFPRF